MELAYSGAMGIHLFMGQEDLNPKNSNLSSAQLAQNVSTTGTINDPLGRINPITGKVLTVQNGTLGSPYLGYSSLYLWYDASGNSIRHAGLCQRGAPRGARADVQRQLHAIANPLTTLPARAATRTS